MSKPTRPPIKPQSSHTTVRQTCNQPATRQKPTASSVYRPQPAPKVLQTKVAAPQSHLRQTKAGPVAPPVYRPQSRPDAVQQKAAQPSQLKTPAAAPPAYRPQPTPKVLQRKAATNQQPSVSQTNRAPTAPPAGRPQAVQKIIQTKAAARGGAPLNVAVQGKISGKPQQGLPPAAAGRSNTSRGGGGRVIQRLVLSMGPDQAHAVSVLAKSREGFFSSAEEYGPFAGYPNFTANADKNVTLWGHAGQNRYGGMSVDELVLALKVKKFDESAHTVLELIGCGPNKTNDQATETYAQLLQKTLDEDGDFKRKITVMAHPMPEPGGDSINYRFDVIDKFVYIYGDAEKLKDARKRFSQMDKVYCQHSPPTQHEEEQFYAKFIQYLNGIKELKYHTGHYKNIRSYLEKTHVVKTHKKTGLLGSVESDDNQMLIKKVY